MMKIKVSDFIAQFLKNRGIRHVFGITGGASIHMLHSASKYGLNVVCNHHEQGCGFAADGYARINGMGCAMATSGPGATNLITAISGCYFDSIPCVFLCGQVVRNRMKGNTGVRQLGFQETDILSMVRPITKYSTQVLNAKNIRYELERAWYIAKTGRPGPVVLDIPDDIQRELVDTEELAPYMFDLDIGIKGPTILEDASVNKCIDLLKNAERPVLVCGWGIRLAKAEVELLKLIKKLNIPVCPSWGLMDLINPLPQFVGGIGINGSRAGNFAVQNADLLLIIGSRLSTRETGNPLESFARAAKMIMVDIDSSEIQKFPHFGKKIDLPIVSDAKEFCTALNNKVDFDLNEQISTWSQKISDWKTRYDPDLSIYHGHEPVDPYVFIDKLSKNLNPGAIIISDTGCCIPWLNQAFKFKSNQRLFHDFNNTSMGWAIPAAIGAHFASGKEIICVVGDGSFLMNVQELATIMHHKLPIKIFLLNNKGYGMVKQTSEEWFDSEYIATGSESLSFPSYHLLADSFKIHYNRVEKTHELDWVINRVVRTNGPVLCNVIIPEAARVWPKLKFGHVLEDMHPLLSKEELEENMVVPLWDKRNVL